MEPIDQVLPVDDAGSTPMRTAADCIDAAFLETAFTLEQIKRTNGTQTGCVDEPQCVFLSPEAVSSAMAQK